ncbi:MAG: VanW family protein [Lachnospiraceae bacterium]
MTRRRESTGRTKDAGSTEPVRHIKEAKRAIEAKSTRGAESPKSAKKHRKSNRRRKIQRRKRMKALFGLILFCVILVTGISYIVLHKYVSKYPEDKICENIYISSVNVSGMTKKEASAAMEEYLEKNSQIKVTLKVGKKSAETTLGELGLEYKNIKETINTAYNYGKNGNLLQKYFKLRKLSKEKLTIKEKYALSGKTSKKTLKEKAVPLANHVVNATMTKTSDGFDIIPEKSGKTVNIKKSVAAIEKKLNAGWKKKEFSVKMVQKKENPTVKEEDLKTVKDKLGSYSTDAGGGERWQNLKTGVEKIDGTVLAPGEEVSVHALTAPYDKEHGYVAAGSYENGQVVETYGGGICQVSTTLYNAILFAELEVTERYPHSMLVAYIDPSRDAAIAGDVKDLKFKNNYDTPVYIEGYIDDSNQLTFNIYGKETREKGRTVEYESETLSTEEPGKTYKSDASAPLGSIEYEGSPHTGKTARLWKTVKKDGKKVSRDVVNESTYQKSDQIIVVGTASENAEASGLVESAIATQDGDKINEAISKAKAMQ